MIKILLVDDETTTLETVSWYLKKDGAAVYTATNGEAALELEASVHPDIIVLDVVMSGMSGWEVAQRIQRQVPIIYLSALSQESDILHGFNLGAEDYVTKPFSPRELVARIKVTLKHHGKLLDNGQLQLLPFVIDSQKRLIQANDLSLDLAGKEFDLFLFLLHHPNTVFSRESLIFTVWGYDYNGDNRVVDTTIKRIRHKIGEYRDFLQTVRGAGYIWEVPTL